MYDVWLLFVVIACVIVAVITLVADAVSRRWIRRLQHLERARLDWQARVIESQAFWRQK